MVTFTSCPLGFAGLVALINPSGGDDGSSSGLCVYASALCMYACVCALQSMLGVRLHGRRHSPSSSTTFKNSIHTMKYCKLICKNELLILHGLTNNMCDLIHFSTARSLSLVEVTHHLVTDILVLPHPFVTGNSKGSGSSDDILRRSVLKLFNELLQGQCSI